MSETFEGPAAARPAYSGGYKAWVLAILVAVCTSNFIDRTIVSVLGEAIKADLKLADWQLGVLGGLSFAVFYTVLGIPIARLAERRNRVKIIAASVFVWSLMTALCGGAAVYWQLLLCRIGVGVGEAGCTPPSHSVISDYFGPARRATALSIYSLGIPLGHLFGALAGGWIAMTLDWRVAFVLVGVPGMVLAVVVRFGIKEPPRGNAEPGRPAADTAPPFKDVLKVLFRQRAFIHLAIGAGLVSFVGYGVGQFISPYLVRAFGFDYAQAGLVLGLIGGVSAGIGTLMGGPIADWAAKRDLRWYAWTPAVGLVIAAPLYMLGYLQTDARLAVAILLIPGLFHYLYLGPTFGVVHSMVEPRMRASTTALLLLILNLIGLGLGPSAVGALSDLFAAHLFGGFGLGEFTAACPGGRAPPGGAAALADACSYSLATGLRYAIVASLFVLFWAAAHFWLASRTLRQAIAHGAGGA